MKRASDFWRRFRAPFRARVQFFNGHFYRGGVQISREEVEEAELQGVPGATGALVDCAHSRPGPEFPQPPEHPFPAEIAVVAPRFALGDEVLVDQGLPGRVVARELVWTYTVQPDPDAGSRAAVLQIGIAEHDLMIGPGDRP